MHIDEGGSKSEKEKWCGDHDSPSKGAVDKKENLGKCKDEKNQGGCKKKNSRHGGLEKGHASGKEPEKYTVKEVLRTRNTSKNGDDLKESGSTRVEHAIVIQSRVDGDKCLDSEQKLQGPTCDYVRIGLRVSHWVMAIFFMIWVFLLVMCKWIREQKERGFLYFSKQLTFCFQGSRNFLDQVCCYAGLLRTRRPMADEVYQSALFDLVVYFSDEALESMEISVETLRTDYDVEEAHWLVWFWNQGLDIDFPFPQFEAYLLGWVGYAEDRYFYYDSTRELPNEVNDIYWAWADQLVIGSDEEAPEAEPDSSS
ncbi:hypothetical protein KP509_18G076600 [Ceratopteris richardii]|uniref:Uncharacterized protein n=4 Tax=Ceratopteris richardii TaxID=49495 RepID=A0A8T2STA0_CERRI|nr:hypothetical protein KP509_18G076600 [Ceratopteris richardii]